MNKWYTKLLEQKKLWDLAQQNERQKPAGTSTTEFTYMRDQPLENPYQQDEEEEEENDPAPPYQPFPAYSPHSEFPDSRNGSSTSLRSRSTTAESGPPASVRMPPPRLPSGSIGAAPLSLRTQQLPGYIPSPSERSQESYFSPTMETPISSRTSSSSGMYPFPHQVIPYQEGHGRYTAPVMSRIPSRENNSALNYPANARGITPRPSFPVGAALQSTQGGQPSRNRSVSTPDINNVQRRTVSGSRPPIPDTPLPPYPPQYMHAATSSRSQTNSPNLSNGTMPGTQSPKIPQSRPMHESSPIDGPIVARPETRLQQAASSRSVTPIQQPHGSFDTTSPLLPPASPLLSSDLGQPSQLKVKVHATSASQVLTLVVPLNISYQSLKDRIDAKLQRSTNLSLSDRTNNQVKLKYLDEEDFVSIQSDEDVQTAFETWREQRGEAVGGMGEIELFCQ